MTPGRELDLLIAQKIFGYGKEIRAAGPTFVELPANIHRDKPVISPDGDLEFLKKYSTDISAAWEVVEKMETYIFTLYQFPKKQYMAVFKYFNDDFEISEMGESAPHAICLAALKAKGVVV